MSTIDYKNIDEWLFNFFEGNLSSEESEVLKRFLNKNPALKADYDSWKKSYVEEPAMAYPNMNALLIPQATPGIKWIAWTIPAVVAVSLVLVYMLNNEVISQLPSVAERHQQFNAAKAGKQAGPVQIKQAETLEDIYDTETGQLQPLTPGFGKEITQPIGLPEHPGTGKPFVMAPRIYSGPIGNPPPDSLEIITKKKESASKMKDGSKSKKKKKEMKIIRLTNTGF